MAKHTGGRFSIDYSVRMDSIPAFSASDVLNGRVPAARLAGKNVLVGTDSDVIGDKYFIPGYGRAGGVYVHAIGGETLKHGRPVDLGWIPGFLLGFAAAAGALLRKRLMERLIIFAAGFGLLLVGPALLEAKLVFADVTPGLFVLLTVASAL